MQKCEDDNNYIKHQVFAQSEKVCVLLRFQVENPHSWLAALSAGQQWRRLYQQSGSNLL